MHQTSIIISPTEQIIDSDHIHQAKSN